MLVGVPSETKNHEGRVAITPAGVHRLVGDGHRMLVQSGAGLASGFADADYAAAGAELVPDAASAWAARLVLKVKEPTPAEYGFLRDDQLLFTYLHLAADRPLTEALLAAGTTAIAYETVQLPDRSLPLLTPMSEVAGRLAPIVGANRLLASAGGRGILPSGVPGTDRARAVVIGGGVAGEGAALTALGLGFDVTVLDVSLPRLRELDARFDGRVRTLASTPYAVGRAVAGADLVIGSVLIPGAAAPKLVTLDMVAGMRPGSVLVDVAIDQGGCFEGSRPTTYDDPAFRVGDVVYYCVANLPGAVPATATPALTNATLPYAARLAGLGADAALAADPALAAGLSTRDGRLVSAAVAAAHGMTAHPA